MATQGSITCWIEQLKEGDPEASQRLWERYWTRLIGLAHNKLRGTANRMADAEDAAQSALISFFRRTDEKGFPQLNDRQDLWQLLVLITACKASNQRRRERAQKRGGGQVRGDSVFGSEGPGIEEVIGDEPTPAFAVAAAEQYERLFKQLENEQGAETLRKVAQMKFEGYSLSDIAEHLDCSERTVKRKLAVIRSVWSKELDDNVT